MREREEEMSRLKRENARLRQAVDTGAEGDGHRLNRVVRSLEEENSRLRARMSEMEAWLASQGLEWTGAEPHRQHMREAEGGGEVEVDAPALVRALRSLSDRAKADRGNIARSRDALGRNAARIQAPEADVAVTVFRDGVYINRGPLRYEAPPGTGAAQVRGLTHTHTPHTPCSGRIRTLWPAVFAGTRWMASFRANSGNSTRRACVAWRCSTHSAAQGAEGLPLSPLTAGAPPPPPGGYERPRPVPGDLCGAQARRGQCARRPPRKRAHRGVPGCG